MIVRDDVRPRRQAAITGHLQELANRTRSFEQRARSTPAPARITGRSADGEQVEHGTDVLDRGRLRVRPDDRDRDALGQRRGRRTSSGRARSAGPGRPSTVARTASSSVAAAVGGVVDLARPLGQPPDGVDEVDLLERLAAADGAVDLADEGEHRRRIGGRRVDADREVRGADRARPEARRGPPRQLAVGLGRERRATLVARGDDRGCRRPGGRRARARKLSPGTVKAMRTPAAAELAAISSATVVGALGSATGSGTSAGSSPSGPSVPASAPLPSSRSSAAGAWSVSVSGARLAPSRARRHRLPGPRWRSARRGGAASRPPVCRPVRRSARGRGVRDVGSSATRWDGRGLEHRREHARDDHDGHDHHDDPSVRPDPGIAGLPVVLELEREPQVQLAQPGDHPLELVLALGRYADRVALDLRLDLGELVADQLARASWRGRRSGRAGA